MPYFKWVVEETKIYFHWSPKLKNFFVLYLYKFKPLIIRFYDFEMKRQSYWAKRGKRDLCNFLLAFWTYFIYRKNRQHWSKEENIRDWDQEVDLFLEAFYKDCSYIEERSFFEKLTLLLWNLNPTRVIDWDWEENWEDAGESDLDEVVDFWNKEQFWSGSDGVQISRKAEIFKLKHVEYYRNLNHFDHIYDSFVGLFLISSNTLHLLKFYFKLSYIFIIYFINGREKDPHSIKSLDYLWWRYNISEDLTVLYIDSYNNDRYFSVGNVSDKSISPKNDFFSIKWSKRIGNRVPITRGSYFFHCWFLEGVHLGNYFKYNSTLGHGNDTMWLTLFFKASFSAIKWVLISSVKFSTRPPLQKPTSFFDSTMDFVDDKSFLPFFWWR